MRIGHIELMCRDTAATRAFYERLGFTRAVEQGGVFHWLATEEGGLEILLRPGEPPAAGAGYPATPTGIVLYTDDYPGTMARIRAAGIESDGEDRGCPLFRDPDGRWLQIVDPADHGG